MPRGKPNVNKPLLDYLTEMIPDQSEKMQHVVKKAIRGLRAHPTKVCTKQEALKVYGVGEWVATRLETYMINNSHLFRPSTTILNSFQPPPDVQQSQHPEQQQQQQQTQHLSATDSHSRAMPSHPPSAAELLTEEEIFESPNPMLPNRRRVSRGRARGRGRGRGRGNGSGASSVRDNMPNNSTHEEFQHGGSSVPEQHPDDDFVASFQTETAGTADGRGRARGCGCARGRGRGRGRGTSSHRDDYHDEEESWKADTAAVKAADLAAAVRLERERNGVRHDGLRFAPRSGIQRNDSQYAVDDQSSTGLNLRSRQADSNAELAQMFLDQSAKRLHSIYGCGKEFGNGFPIRSQSQAQKRKHSSTDHQSHFISSLTHPTADKKEEPIPALTDPVPQKPQKRFAEAQVERSVRVIKQLSVFSEEDCLAELAIVFEAGDFPRTDDKLYEVLSNRLWERQQSTQRTQRSPRFTAARVNALARSICGGRPSTFVEEDFEESDDEIRPVPSSSRLSIHTDAVKIGHSSPPRTISTPVNRRKARNNLRQKQAEVITIDDSEDDSIICLSPEEAKPFPLRKDRSAQPSNSIHPTTTPPRDFSSYPTGGSDLFGLSRASEQLSQ